jgi:hypothetical protein
MTTTGHHKRPAVLPSPLPPLQNFTPAQDEKISAVDESRTRKLLFEASNEKFDCYDDFVEGDYNDESGEREEPISISPRDSLSYIDDKRAWKEHSKFLKENPGLSKLISLMEYSVLEVKPKNIAEFLAMEFFGESNQVKLRRELKEVKEHVTYR